MRLKKHILIPLLTLVFVAGIAQTKLPQEKIYKDNFVHEALELCDFNKLETDLAGVLHIPSYQVTEFMQFAFRTKDISTDEYLHLVEKGKITAANAQQYWDDKLDVFTKLYYKQYIPYQESLQAMRKGAYGPDSVMTGGENCNNLDFTTGTTAGWNGKWSNVSNYAGQGSYGAMSVNGFNTAANPNRMGFVHEMCTSGQDRNVPVNVVPPGHSVSLRLGNDSGYRCIGPSNAFYPYNHQIATNTFQVTEQNKAISYWYAVVVTQFVPNNHQSYNQPYLKIRMYDQNGSEIVCARYDVNSITASTIGGFKSEYYYPPYSNGSAYEFLYKDWSQVMIPLSDYVGQNVTISFETSDCAAGGHPGYAYIAVDCAPLPTIQVNQVPCPDGTTQLVGPAGAATYSWTGLGIVGSNSTQTISVNQGGHYTVTMTTIGNSGYTCSFSSDTIIPQPLPAPVTAFTYTPECAGVPIQFSDASNLYSEVLSSVSWDFGDGATSTALNPQHAYAMGGPNTYTVNYTITTTDGCVHTYSSPVNLSPNPPASFTSDVVCVGGPTVFTNTTSGAGNSYVWDLGDGSSSGTTNPSHAYSNAGTYTVTLTMTTVDGCFNSTTGTVTVQALPTANFTHGTACEGSPMAFHDASSILTGTVFWNFGDPSTLADTSAIQNPTYQYNTSGTYTVSLHIDGGSYCVANTTQTITVNPIPVINVTDPAPVCPGETIPVPNVTTAPASGVTYTWSNTNIHTGMASSGINLPAATTAASNTSGSNITGVVTLNPTLNGCVGDPASYTVIVKPTPIMIIPMVEYCPDETTALINFNSTPAGATTYSWTVSGGSSIGLTQAQGNGGIPSFTTINATNVPQSANVTVQATLNSCPSSLGHFPIVINPYPAASFTSAKACEGNPTGFMSTSTVNGSAIASSLWDFDNDGMYDDGNGVQASYIFPVSGDYTVNMEVFSSKGCKDQTSQIIHVDYTPVVSFSGDVLEGCSPHSVTFNGNATIPSPQTITGYNWIFGNTETATGSGPVGTVYENPSHTTNQYYTVTLQATSSEGCVGTAVKQDYVTVYPIPKADFTTNPEIIDILNPDVNFMSLAEGADSTILYYFNDPEASESDNYSWLTNPVHVYPSVPQTYDVTQWVVNIHGCKDSITKSLIIRDAFTFFIPNAFTPNNKDDINPIFYGYGVGIKDSTYKMLIYDRWGEKIFEGHGMEQGWDGTFKGRICQNDVYIYKVYFDDIFGAGHEYAGHVTLVR